jgi:hypothetical protein
LCRDLSKNDKVNNGKFLTMKIVCTQKLMTGLPPYSRLSS